MTSGWEAASAPIQLASPWEAFWVRPYLDPPLGLYLDMQAALHRAQAEPTEASIDALIATIPPLIAEHNITARDGSPIEWKSRALGSRLILATVEAIKRVQDGGEPADPLPPSRKPATSLQRGSRPNRSRSTTRSGGSRRA